MAFNDTGSWDNSTSLDEFEGLGPEATMSIAISAISSLLIAFFFVLYLIAYHFHEGKAILSKIPHSKSVQQPTLIKRGCCYQVFWKYLWQDFKDSFISPSPFFLHYFAVANFVFTFMQMVVYMAAYFPSLTDENLTWLYSFNISGYAAAKFSLGGFYILRYQLTLHEVKEEQPRMVGFLWLLNLTAFTFNFTSQFSDPPYLELIPVNAGIACTVLFAIIDTVMNLILLYMFVKPLSIHVKKLRETSHASQSGNKTFEKSRKKGKGKNDVVQEEERRIRTLKEVVRWCIITCAIACTLTVLDNLSYCFAYYIYPDVVSDDGNYAPLFVFYSWVLCAESVFCAVVPAANYRSFKKYCCICKPSRPAEEETQLHSSTAAAASPKADKSKPVAAVDIEVATNPASNI
jgi:hypothetical protein